jgi:hypothetical protein
LFFRNFYIVRHPWKQYGPNYSPLIFTFILPTEALAEVGFCLLMAAPKLEISGMIFDLLHKKNPRCEQRGNN